ncbi:putative cytochrome P450 [Meredithblackwellia eburnea MCA 4105]
MSPGLKVPSQDNLSIDDFDPTVTNNPVDVYQQYEMMRAQCPVARTSAYGGYWALTRYEDVKKAATTSDLFISSVKAVVPSDPRGLRRPPLNFDAPHHTPYRTALDRTLKPARLKRLEALLEQHAHNELLPLLTAGHGDICCDFATKYVGWVETEWLNLPPSMAPILSDAAAKWVRAWRDLDSETTTRYSTVMYEMARDLVSMRREDPLDPEEDPASSLLLEVGSDGKPLEDMHLIGALRQSLVVGTVAPPIILGSIAKHLTEDPELQHELREKPELIPAAVEEFIRLYTPYRGFARTVAKDVTLHGVTIQPGEPVTLTYASANRDETVFPDADKFVLHRSNISSHLGFGAGRHRCAGMALARLTIQVALRVLLRETSSIKANGALGFAPMPELGATMCPVTLVPAF